MGSHACHWTFCLPVYSFVGKPYLSRKDGLWLQQVTTPVQPHNHTDNNELHAMLYIINVVRLLCFMILSSQRVYKITICWMHGINNHRLKCFDYIHDRLSWALIFSRLDIVNEFLTSDIFNLQWLDWDIIPC